MEQSQYKVTFESLEWQDGIRGARFKAFRSGNKQIRLLEFTSEFIEPDWCEKGHVGFVIEGELEIDFRGTVMRYPKGSALLIPSGVMSGHKARSIAAVTQLFLVEEIN